MNTEVESIGSEENKNKKKPEAKSSLQRVSLPEDVASKANETLQTLKDRGADVKLEELFHDLLERVDDRYWKRQIERLTPDTFIFEQAKSDPELLQALIKKAKRGLEKKNRTVSDSSSKKRKANTAEEGVA